MTFKQLFSPCVFGHGERVRDFQRNAAGEIVEPRKRIFRCARCHQDLGVILPDQGYPVPPIQPLQAKKLKKARKVRKPVFGPKVRAIR